MGYLPGGSYYKEFVTSSPSTGAAANADSLPTATANRNGSDDGSFTLTVTNIDTGRYKITGTIPSYSARDVVNISVAATCSSIAGKAVVDTFLIDGPVTLASNGLDAIVVEVGLNARQALSIIAAATGGVDSGANTTSMVFLGAGVTSQRITATVDQYGNRSVVTLTPPT